MANVLSVMIRDSTRQKFQIWKILLIGIVFSLVFFLIIQGKLTELAILVVGSWFVVLSYYYPMPGIFGLMIFSTNVLEFIDMKYLPYWKVGPGLRINLCDGLLITMFAIAIFKLYQRHERPLFLKPIILLAGMVVVQFIVTLITGYTNLDTGMNLFRTMFTYVFYFVIVACVDSPKRFRLLIGMIFLFLVVSVSLQIFEASLGHRLTLGLISSKYFDTGVSVMIAGQAIPYIWNRATIYIYVGLFLSLGAMFSGIRFYQFFPIFLLGAIGFIISFVRVWYLMIFAGLLVTLILQKGRSFRTALIVPIAGVGLLGVISLLSRFVPATYEGSLLNVWLGRLGMINRQTETFVSRIDLWKTQLEYFSQSPIFGYGMSPTFDKIRSGDTGFINTLIQFGIMGLAVIIILIVSVLIKGYQLSRRLEPSLQHGYVTGILGLWIGTLVGYSFSWNFYTMQMGIWGITLAMAILDRIWFFHSENKMLDKQKIDVQTESRV
jgi:hypothetical protein